MNNEEIKQLVDTMPCGSITICDEDKDGSRRYINLTKSESDSSVWKTYIFPILLAIVILMIGVVIGG